MAAGKCVRRPSNRCDASSLRLLRQSCVIDPHARRVKDLRSTNAEVRWRRASDLAQVLKRDEALAANAKFSLDLAGLLRQALRDNEYSERRYQEKSAEDRREALKALQDERAFIEFLIASLGNFSVPTGVSRRSLNRVTPARSARMIAPVQRRPISSTADR